MSTFFQVYNLTVNLKMEPACTLYQKPLLYPGLELKNRPLKNLIILLPTAARNLHWVRKPKKIVDVPISSYFSKRSTIVPFTSFS